LGKLVVERATRELALAPPDASAGDLLRDQAIKLNRRLPPPDKIRRIVYRIQVPGVKESAKAFATDGLRQKVIGFDDDTHVVDLQVTPVRSPRDLKEPKDAPAEFLESNKFINCEDEGVRKAARKAVGDEKDPWQKARKIERWVRDNMKVLNFTQAMATSDEVARTLEGDCTEFAMLTAAMCRAEGVPSRTAIGLVYVDRPGAPELAWHMWTEVYIRGQWLGLDATLGRGGISAGHLKVSDHSWHETTNLTPLLPMMQIMTGKTRAEIASIEADD
jgi:transglutaminase-like putative cysteine protease